MSIFVLERILPLRSLMGTGSVCLLQALLGHSSSNTSTATKKGADWQHKHQQVECLACCDFAADDAVQVLLTSSEIRLTFAGYPYKFDR